MSAAGAVARRQGAGLSGAAPGRGGALAKALRGMLPRLVLRAAASLLLVSAGAALVREVPVAPPTWSARQRALAAFPSSLPQPPGTRIVGAGAGKELPYRIDATAPLTPQAVAAYYGRTAATGGWAASAAGARPGRIELLHTNARGRTDFVAHVEVTPDGGASRVIIEFSPLPLVLGGL
ncbi:MAG: hypothetical protein KGK07_02300 [Chloroflexota bacterium]|nr:hypothetical protein [Chloroflexota bacterium]